MNVYSNPTLALSLFLTLTIVFGGLAAGCCRLWRERGRDERYFTAVADIARHVKGTLAPALLESAAREVKVRVQRNLAQSEELHGVLAALAESRGAVSADTTRAKTAVIRAVSRELEPDQLGDLYMAELGSIYGLLRDEIAAPLRAEVQLGVLRRSIPRVFAWACISCALAATGCLVVAAATVLAPLRQLTGVSLGAAAVGIVVGAALGAYGILGEMRFHGVARRWDGTGDEAGDT